MRFPSLAFHVEILKKKFFIDTEKTQENIDSSSRKDTTDGQDAVDNDVKRTTDAIESS